MSYSIRKVRLNLVILFFLVILWTVLAEQYGPSIPLFLVVLILATGLASIRFEINIHEDHFTHQVSFLNQSLFTKEVYSKEINEIKFFRVGWAKKAAKIKLNKGMSIRLAVIDRPEAYDQLLEFANINDISIRKTKDYLILERM